MNITLTGADLNRNIFVYPYHRKSKSGKTTFKTNGNNSKSAEMQKQDRNWQHVSAHIACGEIVIK